MNRIALFLVLALFPLGICMADPKTEVESLMNDAVGIPFAERMLREHGEFLPFGAATTSYGEVISVGALDESDQRNSQELIEILKNAMRASAAAGEYKATAIFYDARVSLPNSGESSDAIAVALDHRDDYSVVIFFPYQIDDEQIIFGNAFAQRGQSDVFSN